MVCVHLYVQQSCPSLAYGDRVNRVSFKGEIRFKKVSCGMRIMCVNLGHFCCHMASIVAVYARFTLTVVSRFQYFLGRLSRLRFKVCSRSRGT